MIRQELEAIIDGATDLERRATAMAALTLVRLLEPEWTHVVTIKNKNESIQKTVIKPAGVTCGDRAGLEKRLEALLQELAA